VLIHLRGLEHSFDQINPPTRTIELIAEKVVRWTGRVAETAMHTLAENLLCSSAVVRLDEALSKFNPHR